MNADDKTLSQRVRLFTWMLPLTLGLSTVLYQIVAARWALSDSSYFVSIVFHTVAGPLLLFWILKLIGHWIEEHEQVARQCSIREERLASIVDTTVDAVFSADAQGKIEIWNRGAELLFGYTGPEIMGCPFSVLLGKGAAAEVETQWLFETIRQEGFLRKHETTCCDSGGHMIDVDLTAASLNSDRGETAGASFILRDITIRKRREEETRGLNTMLNQQAVERACELAEKVDKLAHANTELKQLDQTRSEFVSLVSHQVRAPLTNMAGALQRMQADCQIINPTCMRMFVIFEQQIARLDRLVKDVLNAARIEAGELSLCLEPISLVPVVRQVTQQVCVRTPTRSIHLADKLGLPLVYVDRDRVAEVLSNLLDNADKYSPPSQDVFVDIRADQSEVTVTVRDCGLGLSANFERLFDKFYRTDSGDSQAAYGYGLGLYVCRRLVEAQGGRIWAENHPNGGAVFSFAFPVWQG